MKKFVLILVVLLFTACSRETPESMLISTGVRLSIVDSEGRDLLDPNVSLPGSIKIDAIKIYDLIDGEEVLRRYDELFDNPRRFGFYPPQPKVDDINLHVSDKYTIGFGLCHKKLPDIPVKISEFDNGNGTTILGAICITETIVEWGEGKRNIIRAEIKDFGSSVFSGKIWIDGELVDSEDYKRNSIITIVR